MVVEHLYQVSLLMKKSGYAFLLGLVYSLLGITLALFLFPEDPALVAVAFISILLLPSLYKLIDSEERVEEEERKFTLKHLYWDNKDFIKIYLFISLGIFISFAFFSMVLPNLATYHIFREQVEVQYGDTFSGDLSSNRFGYALTEPNIAGGVHFNNSLFLDIFNNNLKVLIFCFIVSLIAGSGAIFLISWNASVWGTIFGILAKTAAFNAGKNPFIYFFIILIIVLPHGFLEILSYIIASIAGGVLSKGVLVEMSTSKKVFEVFLYNLSLLAVAIIILLAGGIMETYVLNNIELYRTIIIQSFG